MKGRILTKQELVDHLENAVKAIKSGGCPEGTFSWTNLDVNSYEVVAFVRTVGTLGEDASYVIGDLGDV